MKKSLDQLYAEIEFLKTQIAYHTSQCEKFRMALNAVVTGLLILTYMDAKRETERIILEQPRADSDRQIQVHVQELAANMAGFHYKKVMQFTELVADIEAEIADKLHLSATQGKGGNVADDATPAGNG